MMKKLNYILYALFIVVYSTSCQDDLDPIEEIDQNLNSESNFVDYKLLNQDSEVFIDNTNNSILITFAPEITNAESFIADFELSEGATASVSDVLQIDNQTANSYEIPFIYTVTAENGIDKKNWTVSSTNNDFSLDWGLGGFQKISLSNNRDYEWYIDQAFTGTHAGVNCGPTATTIAAKWADPDFTYDPEYARECYRSEGGWWYTTDIEKYFNDNNISHKIISLSLNTAHSIGAIVDQLEDEKILILCLDMYYISDGTNNDWHIDKFYKTNGANWGHFIVVKGYKIVDGAILLEVYDPYGFGKEYSNGEAKGKDRYYRGEDIFKATSIWWNNAIVISEKGGKFNVKANYVKSSEIKPMWGK